MSEQSPAEAIFFAALEIASAEERAAYVNAACGEDTDLRRRVDRLLAAHPQVGSFLEEPAQAPRATEAQASPSPEPGVADSVSEGPGTMIGPYKLLQQLGEGGMGVVFMAEQIKPVQRKVALKIIRPGMDSRQVFARFEAERQALAVMDHPNIAKVFDAGRTETGRPYFVMELVKGKPITQYCDDRRLTPRERLDLFIAVCQAVQHAHQKGIIHRDLKPSNVLIALYDGKPVPKVIDFGVAKAVGPKLTERTLFTEFGQIVGTLEYMSPEQAELNQLDIDTRSDIYSLGVLLYELLTGTTPLEKKRLKELAVLELLRLIREVEPPRPSTRLSTTDELPSVAANRSLEPKKLSGLVRGELDWIVMKALEKDRNRRYETANSLALDLQRYLHDEPVEACPPSAGYRLRKFARKNRVMLSTAAAFVALLVVAAGVSTWLAVVAKRAETVAEEKRQAAEAAQKLASAERTRATQKAEEAVANAKIADGNAAQARANLYVAHMNLAQAAWESGHVARVLELLDLYRKPQPGQQDLRGWEWYYEERLCHEELRTLKWPNSRVNCVAFSPDRKRLASTDGQLDSLVRLWDIATGQELLTLQGHTKGVRALAFSQDGTRLASADNNGTVKVWEAPRGRELHTLNHAGGVWSLAFSSDGKRLASAGGAMTVKLWDVASGQESSTLTGHTKGGILSVAFSPDGKLLASGGVVQDGTKIWDTASGRELRTLKGNEHEAWHMAFSPDGTRLTTASFGYDRTAKLLLWDVASGQQLRNLTGHTAWVSDVAFSPDGARLASASLDGTLRLWDSVSGQGLAILKGHLSSVPSVAFSPDGRWLYSAGSDETVRVWDAAGNREPRTLSGHTDYGGVAFVTFSPDGKRLASAGAAGTVRIWDATTGRQVWFAKGHPMFGTGVVSPGVVAFSSDGLRLLSTGPDHMVRAWDAATGQELLALEFDKSDALSAVGFSPDRRMLAAGADSTVRLYDAATGREIRAVKHPGWVRSIAFSADGQRLASAGENGVWLWDVASGKELRTLGRKGAAVAFSQDGGRLASGDGDGTLTVWDLATGHELRTWNGHKGTVSSLTFSPDGRRLASSSNPITADDQLVKVWDSASGQELRALREHGDGVHCVAFSPDGSRLSSAGQDGKLKLWDGRHLTPEIQAERESLMLVESFLGRALTKDQLIENLRSDRTIDEPVRQKALALVEDYWKEVVHEKAFGLVHPLFAKRMLKPDVLDRVRTDNAVSEEVRQEALVLAERWPEDPLSLNEASWAVVAKPGADAAAYRTALLRAEQASRMWKGNIGSQLNTVGVAQYRLGEYQKAVETLERSEKLNAETDLVDHGPCPSDLAFLAMTYHRLGQRERALNYLGRLRERMKKPQWATDEEARSFLREAEELLHPEGKKTKK
jgi:WD40 repeat protein/serine/threonine protein kinase